MATRRRVLKGIGASATLAARDATLRDGRLVTLDTIDAGRTLERVAERLLLPVLRAHERAIEQLVADA